VTSCHAAATVTQYAREDGGWTMSLEVAETNAPEKYLKDIPAKKRFATHSNTLPIAIPAILLLLIGIPALCLWMTPDITQIGSVDAFVYTGYIHNNHSLVQRFGETYYALRVAMIAPLKLAARLLPPEANLVVVRYLMLLLGCGSIFAIVRGSFGAAPTLYSALLLAFAPWYLRSILWQYVDVITYLLAAFACILAPRRPVIQSWAEGKTGDVGVDNSLPLYRILPPNNGSYEF
jgi:hypothetical protein